MADETYMQPRLLTTEIKTDIDFLTKTKKKLYC